MNNLYDVVRQSCDQNKNDITQDNKSIRDKIVPLRKDRK